MPDNRTASGADADADALARLGRALSASRSAPAPAPARPERSPAPPPPPPPSAGPVGYNGAVTDSDAGVREVPLPEREERKRALEAERICYGGADPYVPHRHGVSSLCDESLSISSLAARNAAAGSKLFHEKDEKAVAGSVVDGDLPIRQMVELMTRNKPFDIVGCPFIWYKNCRSTERSRGRSSSYMYLLDLRTISYVDRGIPHSTKSRNGSVSNLSFFAAYRRSHVPVDLVVHCSASLAT